jgi:hypothetical protein
VSEAAYRKEVAAITKRCVALWREGAQNDAIPAEPTVVYEWLHESEEVRESAYCNDVARALETLCYSACFPAADKMFPFNCTDAAYYDTAGIVVIDMAFHVLMADVTGALFVRLGGFIGEETPDAPNN